METTRPHYYYFSSLGAGLFAGASGIFIGHPFDTLKVRLQVGNLLQAPSNTVINIVDSAPGLNLISSSRLYLVALRQLYRGVLPPLLTAGIIQSINFSLYETFKRKARNDYNMSHLQSVFIGGTISGAIISTVSTPVAIIKLQQQVVTSQGMISCARHIYQTHKLKGFYKGFSVVFLMEAFGRGVYLWIYESTKTHIPQIIPSDMIFQTPLQLRMVSAATAGCLSWLLVYPLDVIKSRLHHDLAGVQYAGYRDCASQIFKESGYRGFFRGLSYTLLRAAPVAATILPVYEHSKEFIEARLDQ